MSRAPIPGVDISVKKKADGKVVVTTLTDNEGSFSFTLPPGDYILQVGSDDGIKLADRVSSYPSSSAANAGGADLAAALAQQDEKTKWISVENSRYKFSIEGEGVTVGEASLVAKPPAEGKTKYNEKTNVSTRVSIAIGDKGVQKFADVRISGKVSMQDFH